jgi:hypothetical protein
MLQVFLVDQDAKQRAYRRVAGRVREVGQDFCRRRLATAIYDLHDLALAAAQGLVGHNVVTRSLPVC